MDDTTQSRISDAATRKRRSSILKSQRPPRTPFCELEFNVCTPTDSAKSRRVSFSRRTGVAEFSTNEATTTWKNFYEEHNKSLESSANDSEVNHRKQTVAQLGKRIFDQQFEEVEVVDFVSNLNPGPNISSSISNINFAQQQECIDTKLTIPQNNFELSAFTEQQSKLFGDTLTNTRAGEVSDCINVNFSEIQQIGERDDLDEIQEDLQRQNNIVCRGPFDRDNLSEYIEVDLNMTHVAMRNDESDMSITDTVHSPKVQDVSKSCSIDKNIRVSEDWVADKENIVVNPYVAQRESLNFAINDDVLIFDGKKLIVQTEKSANNDISQTLLPNPSERAPQRKTIVLNYIDDLPNFVEDAQSLKNTSGFTGTQPSLVETQSKLKTPSCNDGWTNVSKTQIVPKVIPDAEKQRTVLYENDIGNISITQALPSNIINEKKRRTTVYENDNGNISITQAVPANILLPGERKEKRKTIIFENEACNVSMTQSVPAKIIPENTAVTNRTIVLNDGFTNVCITQLIHKPAKKETKETRRTVVYEDTTGNISVTQLRTSTTNSDNHAMLPEHSRTVLLESDIADISVTRTLPSNIILHRNLNVTTYENEANVSMTQALPTNILLGDKLETNRRGTILYENNTGNISMTSAVSTNQVIQGVANQQHRNVDSTELEVATNKVLQEVNKEVSANYDKTVVFDMYNEDVSITRAVTLNDVLPGIIDKQNEILSNQNNASEISMTQAVPMYQVTDMINEQKINEINHMEATNAFSHKEDRNIKRRTIVFENDDADISTTQAVPMNQVIDMINEHKQNEINNIEATNQFLHKKDSNNKRRTIVFENDDADISTTQAVPMNQVIDMINEHKQNELNKIEATNPFLHKKDSNNKRRTIVFENDDADISTTQAVPMSQVIDMINEQKQNEINNIEATNAFIHTEDPNKKRITIVFENDGADMSTTQAVPTNQVVDMINEQKQNEINNIEAANAFFHTEDPNDKSRTIVFENDGADMSTTQAVPINQVIDIINGQKLNDNDEINAALNKEKSINESRTTVLCNNVADISLIQSVSRNHMSFDLKNKDKHNDTSAELKIATKTASHLHKHLWSNKKRTIIHHDHKGDKSTSEVSFKSYVSSDQSDKRKTIIVDREKSIENVDLLLKLTDGLQENENSVTLGKEENDVTMTETSDSERSKGKMIMYEQNEDLSVIDAIFGNYNNPMQDETRSAFNETSPINNATTPQPKPAGKPAFQLETFNTSHYKDENKDKTNHDILENLTNLICDVAVYQAVTGERKKAKAKKRDIKSTPNEITSKMERTSHNLAEMSSKNEISQNEENDEHTESISKFDEPQLVGNTSKIDGTEIQDDKPEKSILNDLLDMSHSSIIGKISENIQIKKVSSVQMPPLNTDLVEIKHSNNMIIIKDSDKQISTEESKSPDTREATKNLEKSPLHIEFSNEERSETFEDLHKTKSKLKSVLKRNHSPQPQNIHHEKNLSLNMASAEESLEVIGRKSSKSIKMASNTNEFLEMLSDFTDISRNLDLHLVENDCTREHVVVKGFMALENKEKTEQEPKRSSIAPKRQSIALSREDLLNNISMAGAALQRSRYQLDESDQIEDTAEETPEQDLSRRTTTKPNAEVVKTLHFEDECSISDKSVSNQTLETLLKKTAFEDTSHMRESKTKVIPDFSNIPDGIKELMDDLVKPMADVLPYATTTLDKGIKDCPSTCSVQIQASKVNSSQVDIQSEHYSNLDSVCDDDPNNLCLADPITNAVNRSISRALQKPVLVSPTPTTTPAHTHSEKSLEANMPEKPNRTIGRAVRNDFPAPTIDDAHSSYSPSRVLIFDHNNPLNNVFIAPPQAMEVHRYSPIKSAESIAESHHSANKSVTDTTAESNDRVLNQYLVLSAVANDLQHLTPKHHSMKTANKTDPQSSTKIQNSMETTKEAVTQNISSNQHRKKNINDDEIESITIIQRQTEKVNENDQQITETTNEAGVQSKTAILSKHTSDVSESEKKKDIDINTDIAMKGNKELLEDSSSLTLVDDALNRNKFDWNINIPAYAQSENAGSQPPPLQIIYKLEEPSEDKFDSDLTSYDEKAEKSHKEKKRVSNPKQKREKHCTLSSLDISPKPASKIRKRSNPTYNNEKHPKLVIDIDKDQKSPGKSNKPLKKSKNKSPTIYCQQVTIVKAIDRENIEQKASEKQDEVDKEKEMQVQINTTATGSGTVSESSKTTSIKRSHDLSDQMQSYSKLTSRMSSKELLTESSLSVISSNVQVGECNSYLDIVSKIYSMPLMGTNDCEWESTKGDTWSFLLLHSWLRVTIRFEKCTRVVADTPIVNIMLETLHQGTRHVRRANLADVESKKLIPLDNEASVLDIEAKKNPIASLCIFFAAETMRYCISYGCDTARDVPRLMKQLSNTARFASRWARAMHDSRARLAYSLTNDGYLALKVANTSLHTVWEVTMKLDLVVEAERALPWPRACAVRVSPVVRGRGAGAPPAGDVRALLHNTPRDWGHAPRTLWKIFRYLKHLKVQEEPKTL